MKSERGQTNISVLDLSTHDSYQLPLGIAVLHDTIFFNCGTWFWCFVFYFIWQKCLQHLFLRQLFLFAIGCLLYVPGKIFNVYANTQLLASMIVCTWFQIINIYALLRALLLKMYLSLCIEKIRSSDLRVFCLFQSLYLL